MLMSGSVSCKKHMMPLKQITNILIYNLNVTAYTDKAERKLHFASVLLSYVIPVVCAVTVALFFCVRCDVRRLCRNSNIIQVKLHINNENILDI